LVDLLHYGFAQRALLAGVSVAVLGGVVGFFVVLRNMAFVAEGVSHAALGGVAIGVLLGQVPALAHLPLLHSPTLWAIAFSVAIALTMSALGRRGMDENTAMGILFPAAMALGVVLMGFSPTYQKDLLSYLFGDILAVQPDELYFLLATTVVSVALIALFFKEFLFISFDEESAHASGIPVHIFRSLLLVITAVTVVVAIKAVGVILVAAMLVIPAATAGQLPHRWPWMLALSVLVALIGLVSGLLISFSVPGSTPIPSGPVAVLVAAGLFAAAALARRAGLVGRA
jgi:ABC-type Mn2+/Zn2+ transport system permease subunit